MNPLDSKPGMFDLSWSMFGTPVRVQIWFWLGEAFFGWLMGLLDPPFGWPYLLIWIACGFVSVMVRETGRIIVGRCFGIPGAILLTSFGGKAAGEYERAARWQRILICAASPLTGMLFYGLVYALTHPIVSRLAILGPWEEYALRALLFLTFMNLFWTILALPPILPLDGGSIMKDLIGYVVGRRDFLIATAISIFVAGGIVGYSVYRWYHPDAPYLRVILQPLYPAEFRNHPFAAMDPHPLFGVVIYGLMMLTNIKALFSR